MQKHRTRALATALLAVALAALGLAGSAQAKLTGNYTKFLNCTYTNEQVLKCIDSVTESGEVVLANKKVRIERQVIREGGYGAAIEENEGAELAAFSPSTNGVATTTTPQHVPHSMRALTAN